jgi:hypothetical protein
MGAEVGEGRYRSVSAQETQGRFDKGALRQAQRSGRMKGCSINIAAAELRASGIDPDGPAPRYRIWTGERGRLIVTLYP